MSALPTGWAEAALGEVAETRLGKMLSAKARGGPNPRPYLRNKNVQWGRFDLSDVLVMDFDDDEFERFKVSPGDLLVCEGGEVGRAAIWRGQIGDVGYQKALHRVRPAHGVLAEYLLYAFQWFADTHAFEAFVTGSTINHLPQEDLRRLPIPLPPEAEQRRIVPAIEEQFSRLDAAEESLADARRRVALLRISSRSLAVSGDWPEVALGDVTESQIYGSSAKASADSGGIPMLRMGNIRDGALDFNDLKYLAADHSDIEKCRLQPGDLLFNRTNSPELVGKSAVFTAGPDPTVFASYLIRVRLTPECDSDWAALVINGHLGRQYVASVRTQQVGQANVNGTKLAAMPIPLPPVAEQRRIVDEVERQVSIIDGVDARIDQGLRRSVALRRSILDQAFSGKLVPQDPHDEPASVLLERVAAERAASPKPSRRKMKIPA